MAAIDQVLRMTTTARATEMTNFETLTQAAIRVNDAERSVWIAEIHLTSLVRSVPLRISVAATRRLRVAAVELEAARLAYDAAQDLPAPTD